MWNGFDDTTRRDLAAIREMVARQRQTPSREWPVIYIEDRQLLLVVREWPNGSLTAYCIENTDAGPRR